MPSAKTIKNIRELAKDGKSINQIKNQLNLPKSTVYYHFKKEVGQKQRDNRIKIPKKEEFRGELCGVFAGDGNLYKDNNGHYRIRFYLNYSKDYWKELSSFLERKLKKKPRIYHSKDKNKTVIDYYSKDLYILFSKELNWNEDNKTGTVHIPDLSKKSRRFKIGFARGLIDTDGYKENKFRRYIYGSISLKLRNNFSSILDSLKIQNTCYKEEPSNKKWKTMNKVRISGDSAKKFMKSIEPRNPSRKYRNNELNQT